MYKDVRSLMKTESRSFIRFRIQGQWQTNTYWYSELFCSESRHWLFLGEQEKEDVGNLLQSPFWMGRNDSI